MDALSILGLFFAVGFVLFGMMFDQETMRFMYTNLKAFADLPSLFITLGGTVGAMIIRLIIPRKFLQKDRKALKNNIQASDI